MSTKERHLREPTSMHFNGKRIEPLDHGVLSMPNRTKNINAELDRYKKEHAKDEASKRNQIRIDYYFSTKNSIALYKEHGEKLIKHTIARRKQKGLPFVATKELRDIFKIESQHHPKRFEKIIEQYLEEIKELE